MWPKNHRTLCRAAGLCAVLTTVTSFLSGSEHRQLCECSQQTVQLFLQPDGLWAHKLLIWDFSIGPMFHVGHILKRTDPVCSTQNVMYSHLCLGAGWMAILYRLYLPDKLSHRNFITRGKWWMLEMPGLWRGKETVQKGSDVLQVKLCLQRGSAVLRRLKDSLLKPKRQRVPFQSTVLWQVPTVKAHGWAFIYINIYICKKVLSYYLYIIKYKV